MKKTTLKLANGETITGYEAGNFVVYGRHRVWYVAHKSGYMLYRFFARRRDAVTACQTMEELADWDFDDPLVVALDPCVAAYTAASTWDVTTGVFVPSIP